MIDKLEHADLQSDPDVRRQLLTFVVAGGGFAGVETLAELNDFVRGATKFYPNVLPEDVRMVLVHSGNRILPEVSESLSAYALEKLRNRGVEVLLQTRVLGSTGHSVRLSSGQVMLADTLCWAAGTAAQSDPGSPGPAANQVRQDRGGCHNGCERSSRSVGGG